MKSLTLALATLAIALLPMTAEAGTRTIGLHTAPPVLTTGTDTKPMIQFSAPVIHVPAAPPVVSEGEGYDDGTPRVSEGGYDEGGEGEDDDNPFRP